MQKNYLLAAFLSLTSVFCAGTGQNVAEKNRAELEILRRRESLLSRENSVFREENLENSRRIALLTADIEELKSLNKNLHEEMKRNQEEAEANLNAEKERNRILLENSSQKVKELNQINATREQSSRTRITELQKELKSREEQSAKEISELKKQLANQEIQFKQQVEQLQSSLDVLREENKKLNQKLSQKLNPIVVPEMKKEPLEVESDEID